MSGGICLYLIAESPTGPVKIGISQNPLSRVNQLQTGNPRPLALMGQWKLEHSLAGECERKLHEELAYHRLEGEWFDFHPALAREYVQNFFLAEGVE